jgi:hypothetical protein
MCLHGTLFGGFHRRKKVPVLGIRRSHAAQAQLWREANHKRIYVPYHIPDTLLLVSAKFVASKSCGYNSVAVATYLAFPGGTGTNADNQKPEFRGREATEAYLLNFSG